MSISSRNIKLYLLSQFLYALVFTIPIWIVYYQGRISVSQISFLVAFQYAVQLILEMPTGALADLLGRKYCIAVGYLLWALSFFVVVMSTGFFPLIIASFLGGLAESLISGSLEALVYDSLKQDEKENEYSKVSANNGILFQFALAFATFCGGFFYSLHPLLPYIACVLTNLAAGILALWMIEPKIDSEKFTLRNYIRQIKDGTIHAFANQRVALMSLYYIMVSALTWTNNLFFFDYMLVELGFSDVHRSIIGAVIRVFNVTVLGFLLRNELIFTRQRSIYFFPVMMVLSFLPGVLFSGVWALPFIAGAVMAGTGRWIVLTRYTNEVFESKYRATAISVLSMIIGILFVGITFVSGPIIETHGVRMIYTLLGVTTLFTVVPLSFAVVKMAPTIK